MSSHNTLGEVLAGPERWRRWSADQKREIVSESLQEGAVALSVARRQGISSGLLYTWRRKFAASSARFVPVAVMGEPSVPAQPRRGVQPEPGGVIGIELPGGVRLQVDRDVDAASLRLVLCKRVLSVLESVR
jgi:transposase